MRKRLRRCRREKRSRRSLPARRRARSTPRAAPRRPHSSLGRSDAPRLKAQSSREVFARSRDFAVTHYRRAQRRLRLRLRLRLRRGKKRTRATILSRLRRERSRRRSWSDRQTTPARRAPPTRSPRSRRANVPTRHRSNAARPPRAMSRRPRRRRRPPREREATWTMTWAHSPSVASVARRWRRGWREARPAGVPRARAKMPWDRRAGGPAGLPRARAKMPRDEGGDVDARGTGGSTRVSSVENFTICRSCRSPFPVNRQVEHDNVDIAGRAHGRIPGARRPDGRDGRIRGIRSSPGPRPAAPPGARTHAPRLSGLASPRGKRARSVAPRFVSHDEARRGRRSRRRRRRGRDVSRDAASDGRRETETDRERLSGVLRASERKQSRDVPNVVRGDFVSGVRARQEIRDVAQTPESPVGLHRRARRHRRRRAMVHERVPGCPEHRPGASVRKRSGARRTSEARDFPRRRRVERRSNASSAARPAARAVAGATRAEVVQPRPDDI